MNDYTEKDALCLIALKRACFEQHNHKGGAGGARMCICGMGCGGSDACSGLAMLKNYIMMKLGLTREFFLTWL